ncbi:MAG: bifunctional glutamate N-acetyltransferase/amino-acid acetyltransferase ArgJ [Endomicrobium sp.]|jgi:glutamate N-acetyltransferase/amino-acid N-acetyltransferase|nr:bifunctional glutamate N-acetyltransferase/amino-acid acetyltransferase ArgJ [Endomicrobium sp.]
MLPNGFKVAGVRSGISKKEGKKDLALFLSEFPAAAAGTFTQNMAKAAPVLIDIARLKRGGYFRAVVANSGCANACTGAQGKKNAIEMCMAVEKEFLLPPDCALAASTGVIGQLLNMEKFYGGVKKLNASLGKSAKNEDDAVKAIMTTDTFIKKSSKTIKIKNGSVKIWGCVKGAGMIHPDMAGLHATMLSFILTDARIDSKNLQRTLEKAVDQSFNCVSVDGDTSTNDTVLLLANGQSKTGKLTGKDLKKFADALDEVTLDLAKQIAKDGEGATKFVEIEVKNAKSVNDAKLIARTIATSPLFKTAVFGADANWGRVIAAAGRAGVSFNPAKADITMGGIKTFKNGVPLNFSEKLAKKALLKKEVKVELDLKSGKASSKYYACDFSYDYVRINGDYRS